MRKMFRLVSLTFMAMLIATTAMADGTESNWSVSLLFKLDGVNDVAPIVLGAGSSTDRQLRPPSLPDKALTGDSKDVWVRAYVPDPTSKVEAFKSVEGTNKNVWAIHVDAIEQGHTVTVDVDTTNFNPGYRDVSIVVPGAATPVTDVKTSQSVNLFTTDGNAKTLYIVAGATKAFTALSNGEMIGMVNTVGSLDKPAQAEIKLYTSSGCSGSPVKTATTDSNGFFSMAGVASGDYILRVDKPYHLGGNCQLNTANSSETTCVSLYAGDVNSDGKITVKDLLAIKPYYSKAKGTYPEWDSKGLGILDLNGDEAINMKDLILIKNGYSKAESFTCGS